MRRTWLGRWVDGIPEPVAPMRTKVNVVPPPSLVERMEIAQDGTVPVGNDARDQIIALLRVQLGHLRGAIQDLEHQIVLLAGEVEARRLMAGPTLDEHERLQETVRRYEEQLERCRAEHVDPDEVDRLRAALAQRVVAAQPW